MKNILLASTSTVYGSSYLEYLLAELQLHFKNCNTLLFIPYARPGGITHDEYTAKVALAFAKINIAVKGIHEFENPVEAIHNAEGIFTGGGNTFVLVSQLYKNQLMEVLAQKLKSGTPYLGTSAGSNIAGLTIQTTNDMPIVYPPSFQSLGMIPFNLNPHYINSDGPENHMGEAFFGSMLSRIVIILVLSLLIKRVVSGSDGGFRPASSKLLTSIRSHDNTLCFTFMRE
jgi:dipeptidase E